MRSGLRSALLLVLGGSGAQLAAGFSLTAPLRCVSLAPSASPRARGGAPARAMPAQMQNSMGDTGTNDAEMGNTFWAAWGEEHGMLGGDGVLPAGEDAVEKELKRMFRVDEEEDESFSESEIDDVRVSARRVEACRAPGRSWWPTAPRARRMRVSCGAER
eukprot:6797394-Prymnesium_polylepis.1